MGSSDRKLDRNRTELGINIRVISNLLSTFLTFSIRIRKKVTWNSDVTFTNVITETLIQFLYTFRAMTSIGNNNNAGLFYHKQSFKELNQKQKRILTSLRCRRLYNISEQSWDLLVLTRKKKIVV